MKIKSMMTVAASSLLMLATHAYAAPENFTFDSSHSYVLFKINHFGFSSQSGKWYINGKMTLDKEKPENSKVSADIKIDDIVTGIPELDKHLKGKLFFDSKQFPTAQFVSDKVDVVNDQSANVHGMLTLHGVTKPVTLHVTFNKAGINPINEKNTVGFSAETTLKRSDFGMKSLLPGVGDEVAITIDVEANQPKKAEAAHETI